MGRRRTFDTGEAVRAARQVFWRDGYEAAAVPDLERATGLSRSSIYHAFGSKRGLFDAAVNSYLNEIVRPRLAPLSADTVDPGALDSYLRGMRAALLLEGSLPATSGCLLIRTAAAPIGRDAEVARVVAAYRSELLAAVTAGVRAAAPGVPAAEQQVVSEACTSMLVAALVLVRVDPEGAARTIDAASAVLAALVDRGQPALDPITAPPSRDVGLDE